MPAELGRNGALAEVGRLSLLAQLANHPANQLLAASAPVLLASLTCCHAIRLSGASYRRLIRTFDVPG